MVVEDTPDTAMGLSLGLRRAGALSIEARSSVSQAQKRLVEPPAPDVVLIDNKLMDEATGLELALWMREHPLLHNTLRVSFSGFDPALLSSQFPDDKVYHAMITKPVSLRELIDRLATLLERHRQ